MSELDEALCDLGEVLFGTFRPLLELTATFVLMVATGSWGPMLNYWKNKEEV